MPERLTPSALHVIHGPESGDAGGVVLDDAVTTLVDQMRGVPRFGTFGKVTRVVGLVIEAAGLEVGLGELCRVTSLAGDRSVLAEVVGFHGRGVLLMPLGEMDGLHPGSAVLPLGRSFGVDVGPGLLG